MRFAPVRRRGATVGAQLAALLVLAMVLAHAGIFGLVMAFGVPESLTRDPMTAGGQAAMFVRLFDAQPDEPARDRLVAAAAATTPVRVERIAAPGSAGPVDGDLGRIVGLALGDPGRVAGSDGDVAVTVLDGTGSALRFRVEPAASLLRPRTIPWILTALALLAALSSVGVYAVLRITAPLKAFAAAADAFGREPDHAPLPEGGPREVGLAARALNAMRARVRALLDERTRMLAAFGHDLRTPLTRLRFRAERVAGDGDREAMLRDIDRIDALVRDTLAYVDAVDAPAGAAGPAPATDLRSLLATVCDDYADTGHLVAFAGGPRIAVPGPASALTRLVSNLVDNAVRHGGSARVTLAVEEGRAVVRVADEGPGLPPGFSEAAFEPFRRGDAARSGEGFGLGLAIARGIARRRGGDVTLGPNAPRGALATASLPIAP